MMMKHKFTHNIVMYLLLPLVPLSLSASTGRMEYNKTVITRQTKANLPDNLLAEAKSNKLSIVKPSDADLPNLYKSYPNGSVLFPQNNDLAGKFNTMIKTIQTNSDLIVFFRKIHLTALNELYNYLMKIYTNFNFTNPGVILDTDLPTADISTYVLDEATYATNKKKLIINHFINLIQQQFAKVVLSYNPQTDPETAVSFGKILIQNDFSIDLTEFKTPTDAKKAYFDFLQQYFDFYQTYTNYLNKLDPKFGTNEYYNIAQAIERLLHPVDPKNAATALKMFPDMFFYDQESLRSILFIPFAASTIPATSKLVPWSPLITNAAVKNLSMNGHPIAYFKDTSGAKTQDQSKATTLYMLTETGPYLFEQELLAQPGWLNNKDGCIRILRACLGDCSALVGMGILDENLEKIIQKYAKPAGM